MECINGFGEKELSVKVKKNDWTNQSYQKSFQRKKKDFLILLFKTTRSVRFISVDLHD